MRHLQFRWALAALLCLAPAACGDSDEADGETAGSAVNRELAEEGLDFDASTMDAMSVDVVAGGTPPMADPGSADAGIDMIPEGADANEAQSADADTDEAPADEPAEN